MTDLSMTIRKELRKKVLRKCIDLQLFGEGEPVVEPKKEPEKKEEPKGDKPAWASEILSKLDKLIPSTPAATVVAVPVPEKKEEEKKSAKKSGLLKRLAEFLS